jgi:hypothetical protein
MLINILELFIGTPMAQSNIVIETSGITAALATDTAIYGGATSNFQIMKMAHGISGTVTLASSVSPLPVTVMAGLTATISGFSGLISVQGTAAGYPLPISGTVYAIGITGSPVYVKTGTGYQVEVTGGRYLGKSTDSVSVWGPSGLTYIYAHLVTASGNSLSYTNGALNVNITGATISATIPSTVTVVGLSGATAVNVTVGNTLGINDTNIINGMTAIYSQVVGLRSDLGGFAVTRPSSFKNSRVSATTTVSQLDVSGFSASSGINLKALSTNTDFIFIGNTGSFVGSSTGFAMDPGDSVFLNISNTNKLFIQANSGTQVITFMAS